MGLLKKSMKVSVVKLRAYNAKRECLYERVMDLDEFLPNIGSFTLKFNKQLFSLDEGFAYGDYITTAGKAIFKEFIDHANDQIETFEVVLE